MFNTISYKYSHTDASYVFSGWLGMRFRIGVASVGYSENKHKYLFNKISSTGFTIPRFFIPDLYFVCKSLLSKGSIFGVNMGAVQQIIDIVDNEIINKSRISLDLSVIERDFVFKPLKTQLPAYEAYSRIRMINGSRGMLLDGAIGVGKTFIGLTLARALHSEVTLIVTPLATLETVWLNSLNGDGCLFKVPQKAFVVGNPVSDYAGEQYVVVHYENLKLVLGLFKEYNINFTTIIVDEVHSFNDIKSSRTKLLMDVVDGIRFKHAIPMSGTPIKARPKDLIPLLKIINSDFTNKLVSRFTRLYKGRSGLMLEVLKERYDDYTVVIRKSDMDIPPVNVVTTKVKLPYSTTYTIDNIRKRMRAYMDQREEVLTEQKGRYDTIYLTLYNSVKDDMLASGVLDATAFNRYERAIDTIINNYNHNNLGMVSDEVRQANLFEKNYIEPRLAGVERKKFREAKTVHKYLRLKVQGEALANIVMKARIDCYTELASKEGSLLRYINSTVKKSIFFSNYISVCDAISNNCIKDGLVPIRVYGDSAKYLSKSVGVFTNDKRVNPLVTTFKSLSTGVPLIVANVITIFGLPHRQYILDQAIGRVWRNGQDVPVYVYVVELDTGDTPNITDRDFDIISFFREEVARLTGNVDAVIIDKTPNLQEELSVVGFLEPNDNYLAKAIRSTKDRIINWA